MTVPDKQRVTPTHEAPATMNVFWCPACGWDDVAWGPDFWQRHAEDREHRVPGLPCLDGGTTIRKLTYALARNVP